MADIPVTFTTNAPEKAREVDALTAAIKRESEAKARSDKAVKSIISAQRAERQATYELRREVETLTKSRQVTGRVLSANPTSLGRRSNGLATPDPRWNVLQRTGQVLRGANGIPFAESAGRYAQILGGAIGPTVAAAAIPLITAGILWRKSAVKAEMAADILIATAEASKAMAKARESGERNRQSGAMGSFQSNEAALRLLNSRGGSEGVASGRRMVKSGYSDGLQGAAEMYRIQDPGKRSDAYLAAKGAADTGEGTFSGFMSKLASGEVSMSGGTDDTIRRLIGDSRGTGPISNAEFSKMRANSRNDTAFTLNAGRDYAGQAASAGLDTAFDISGVTGGFAREARETADPVGTSIKAAVKSMQEAITARKIAATAEDGMTASLRDLAAALGLSKGSEGAQAREYERATRAGAGF